MRQDLRAWRRWPPPPRFHHVFVVDDCLVFVRDDLRSCSKLPFPPGRAASGQWRTLPAANQTQARTHARFRHACACARMCNRTASTPASTLTAACASIYARVGGGHPIIESTMAALVYAYLLLARASRAMICALVLSSHLHLVGQPQASVAHSLPPTRPSHGHTNALGTQAHVHACIIAQRPHPRQR